MGKNKRAFWTFLSSYISIMLIPLLLMVGVWGPQMQKSAKSKAELQQVNSLSQIAEQMDQQLGVVYSLPNQIFNHHQILLSTVMDDPIKKIALLKELNELLKTNTFIDFALLYLRESDYFLSSNGNTFYFSDMGKYPGTFKLSFSNMPMYEMYDLLETVDEPKVMHVSSTVLRDNRYDDVQLFFMPVPSGRHAMATCVICVKDSNVNKITKYVSSAGGIVAFFDDQGNLIYQSQNMTEDEIAIVKESSSFATNGADVRNISLSDGEYSLASIKSIKTGWYYTVIVPMSTVFKDAYAMQHDMIVMLVIVILLSSLAIILAMNMNYRPLRRLSQMAASHVSSSPGQGKGEYERIQALIEQLYSENTELDRELTHSNTHVKDALLTQILCGNRDEIQRAINSAKALHLDMGEGNWQLLLAEYRDKESADSAATLIMAESDLFVIRAANPEQMVCVRHDVFDEKVPEAIISIIGGPSRLVISAMVESLEDLSRAYLTTCSAMDYSRSADLEQNVLYCSSLQERFYNPRFYPLDVMQALETTIAHGGKKQLEELMSQIEMLLSVQDAPPYYVRSIYYNTISLLINGIRAKNQGNDELIGELTTQSILPRYTVHEMINILHSTAAKLSLEMDSKEEMNALWAQALAYIDQRIASPDFCLQEAADQMGMSPSTFSRSFKETIGKNFKEYVDDRRIQMARELLSKENMSIESVAVAVGYENLTSFYRFFKKQTGVAPGTFRAASRDEKKG